MHVWLRKCKKSKIETMNPKINSSKRTCRIITIVLLLTLTAPLHGADKWKALIVDGQNNHKVWPKSTVMMKQYLEATGLFQVDVARTKFGFIDKKD